MTLSLTYIVKVVAPSKVPKDLSGSHCSQNSYEQKKFYKQIFFPDNMYIFLCCKGIGRGGCAPPPAGGGASPLFSAPPLEKK